MNKKAIERIYRTIDKQRKLIKAEDENVIAHKEMCRRERFNYLQSKLIDNNLRNPVCVVPNANIRALDMMPRIDICEDIHFRKRLPKRYKKICRLEGLNEDKYGKKKLIDPKVMMKQTNQASVARLEKMRAGRVNFSLGQMKNELQFESSQSSGEETELRQVAKSVVVSKSGSLKAMHSRLNHKELRRLMGEEDARVPRGANKNLKVLTRLDEQKLLEANRMICEKYQRELCFRQNGSMFVIDVDDGIPLGAFRNFGELVMLKYRAKLGLIPQPFEGPPLKHRPGHLKWTVPTNVLIEERKLEKAFEASRPILEDVIKRRQSYMDTSGKTLLSDDYEKNILLRLSSQRKATNIDARFREERFKPRLSIQLNEDEYMAAIDQIFKEDSQPVSPSDSKKRPKEKRRIERDSPRTL